MRSYPIACAEDHVDAEFFPQQRYAAGHFAYLEGEPLGRGFTLKSGGLADILRPPLTAEQSHGRND